MALKLISFTICPFVQRSVITLTEKEVDFEISYIDLANKPNWFLKLSPLGKVPLLQIDHQVLFESSAINEYLEDTYTPKLHPTDLFIRATNRAWIEVANQISATQFKLAMAQQTTDGKIALQRLIELLHQLENQLEAGPFFNGEAFSLIDSCLAPFFTRQRLLNHYLDPIPTVALPKVTAYGKQLLARKSVIGSVVTDYQQIYQQRLIQQQSWLLL